MSYSRGKLSKHSILSRSTKLAGCLPTTRKMTEENLHTMLLRYGKAIVKPSSGWGGKGIISVALQRDGTYKLHYDKKIKIWRTWRETYQFIRVRTKSKGHIVQRTISLAKVKGRPFDVRVMVQRRRKSQWKVTGKLAKVAGSGYIVTNIARSKGRVLPLSTAIRSSNITGKSSSQIQNNINRIALTSASCLQKHYRIKTIGLDIGIDSRGKVWIIEANFSPAKSLFLKLKDKSMYRRIVSYRS